MPGHGVDCQDTWISGGEVKVFELIVGDPAADVRLERIRQNLPGISFYNDDSPSVRLAGWQLGSAPCRMIA